MLVNELTEFEVTGAHCELDDFNFGLQISISVVSFVGKSRIARTLTDWVELESCEFWKLLW